MTGGFLKNLTYTPDGTPYTGFSFQAVILNGTTNSVGNVSSTYLTVYDPYKKTWLTFDEMCSSCAANYDYSALFPSAIWYYTSNGQHQITFGNNPFSSSKSSLNYPLPLVVTFAALWATLAPTMASSVRTEFRLTLLTLTLALPLLLLSVPFI